MLTYEEYIKLIQDGTILTLSQYKELIQLANEKLDEILEKNKDVLVRLKNM